MLGVIMFSTMSMASDKIKALPEGFVFLTDVDSTIIEDVRYFGSENFMGKPVPGYTVNRIICTEKAALALKAVHDVLKKQGFVLVVYDGYRAQRSVDAFLEWAEDDDTRGKANYYPTLTKHEIFENGFISPHSEHTRGSTFDLTIIPVGSTLKPVRVTERMLKNGEKISFLDDNTVDMGSSFDLFHPVSHQNNSLITEKEMQNRVLLRKAMTDGGFKGYSEEWWHYRLVNEPFPDTYFDFVF
jgi:D-alanyl-D-alanine dipeptidase